MQSTGDLVSAAAELSAGVKDRHDHLKGGFIGLDMLVDRNAAAVVPDRYNPILVDGADDCVAVPAERFIDGVVHDFADEVMQPPVIGAADIHTGPATDGLEALENLN